MNVSSPIETRKLDHITINLERNVEVSGLSTGFERLQFTNNALPEIDLESVNTGIEFLGMTLCAPILVSSMTGGVERGWEITRRLAIAAQELGCAIAVGSQRAALEDARRERFFVIRDLAPDVPIFANLGAVQLNYGYGVDECRRAIDMIQGNGLFLHLNPLQEALQLGGNTAFGVLERKIEQVCRHLDAPVIVKEVGFGVSADVAKRLADCGVAGIDVSGAGGTSWSAVEHLRSADVSSREVSRAFLGWGVPTARCLVDVRKMLPDLPLIASGGMRTGLDAAKALALGACLTGIAGPLLRAAAESETQAVAALRGVVEELRVTMFAVGAARVADLTPRLLFELDAPLLSQESKTPS